MHGSRPAARQQSTLVLCLDSSSCCSVSSRVAGSIFAGTRRKPPAFVTCCCPGMPAWEMLGWLGTPLTGLSGHKYPSGVAWALTGSNPSPGKWLAWRRPHCLWEEKEEGPVPETRMQTSGEWGGVEGCWKGPGKGSLGTLPVSQDGKLQQETWWRSGVWVKEQPLERGLLYAASNPWPSQAGWIAAPQGFTQGSLSALPGDGRLIRRHALPLNYSPLPY